MIEDCSFEILNKNNLKKILLLRNQKNLIKAQAQHPNIDNPSSFRAKN